MFYLLEGRISFIFLIIVLFTFSELRFSKKIIITMTVFMFALTSFMDYFVYMSNNELLTLFVLLKGVLIILFGFFICQYQDFRGLFLSLFAVALTLVGGTISTLLFKVSEELIGSILLLVALDSVAYAVMHLSAKKQLTTALEENEHQWSAICLLPITYIVSILLLIAQPNIEVLTHYYYLGIVFADIFAFFVFEIFVRTGARIKRTQEDGNDNAHFGTHTGIGQTVIDEEQPEKKSIDIFGLALVISFFVIAGMFTFLYVKNCQANKNGKTLTLAEVTSDEAMDGDVMVKIEQRKGKSDSWTKGINLGKPGYYELQAYTYDMLITNRSESQIEEWGFEFTAPQNMYINKAWCGTVEIHQSSEYETIVEELDLREVDIDKVKLNHVEDDTDLIIPIKKGNKVIYHPNTTVYEYPITASNPGTNEYNNVKIGFIFYYDDGVKPLPITDGKFSYIIKYVFWDQPSTKLLMAIAFIWIVGMMFYLGLVARRKSYEAKLLKDRKTIHEIMDVFTGFVDAKDTYTAGHSDRVAVYSRLIAEKMGYSEEEALQVYYAGQLHDCGKVGIPESILNKAGKLTPEEFGVIKSHTTCGYDMLKKLDTIPTAAIVAKYHHERYDGTGYPEGLKGEEIPEIARIACVADAFDAMNSSRVYRPRLERSYIVSQLEQGRGTQFDPKIADLFLGLIADGSVDNAYGDVYFKQVCAEILED